MDLNVIVNPRVEESKKEVKLQLKTYLEQIEKQADVRHLDIAVTPVWRTEGTYKIFIQAQTLLGRTIPTLSWIEAGQEAVLERLITLQYGWNKQFNNQAQDLMIKYNVGKSPLQKLFEREDVLLQEGECRMCEDLTEQTGVFTNIYCEFCLMKRHQRTLKEYNVFVNKQQVTCDCED